MNLQEISLRRMYTMAVYIEYKLENKDKLNNFSARIEHFCTSHSITVMGIVGILNIQN